MFRPEPLHVGSTKIQSNPFWAHKNLTQSMVSIYMEATKFNPIHVGPIKIQPNPCLAYQNLIQSTWDPPKFTLFYF